MGLASDFNEAAGRVQVLADGVLRHCFDYRENHFFGSEIIQSVFDELPAQTAASELSDHSQVGNASSAGFAIDTSRDIADHAAVGLSDKNPSWIGSHIFVYVSRFAPAPIMSVENSEMSFDIFFDGHAAKGLNGQPFYRFQVRGSIRSK